MGPQCRHLLHRPLTRGRCVLWSAGTVSSAFHVSRCKTWLPRGDSTSPLQETQKDVWIGFVLDTQPMAGLEGAYAADRRKYAAIKEWRCTNRKCRRNRRSWWGTTRNATCKDCGAGAAQVPLEEQRGVAWFRCDCGRVFRSLAQGEPSFYCPCKASGCGRHVRPEFFIPSNNDPNGGKSNTHHCSLCNGLGNCPLARNNY